MARDLGTRLKVSAATRIALITNCKSILESDGTACYNAGFSTGLYLCPESYISTDNKQVLLLNRKIAV